MKKSKVLMMFLLLLVVAFQSFGQNYAEALQKAIYFYEAQQAGPLPPWNRVEWRGDATMDDDVLGGLYDAGDHVKFGLPMAYTASMLGWAAYEYKSAFQASGQWEAISNNLSFILDYFVAAHQGNKLVYQIGNGSADHSWWGPVEVIHKESSAGKRPSFSTNASCVTAQTAAALAIGSIVLNNSTYLSHAKDLFDIANTTRSDNGYTAASGFYNSWSGYIDEIQWAGLWLYLATNKSSYLQIAEDMVPLLNRQGQSSDIEYKWAHCWDDSHYGAMLMLAKITNKPVYVDFTHRHLDWWAAGAKGFTPAGLAWLDTWGSLRYATTAAFLCMVYSDWDGADVQKASQYLTFAENQVNYALGDNERNASYVVGYGINPPEHPHHRTSHGSWTDQQKNPPEHRHILYGALVGGPNQSGGYKDEIGDYVSNEVATDYNAGFVGALAKMVDLYGGSPLENFPAPETKDDEFFVEAIRNSEGSSHTELKILVNNRSAWPARLIKDLNFNIYFDLSEVIDAGYSPADISTGTNYVEFPITISPIQKYSGTIYYVNVAFVDGTDIYPGGQSEYSAEIQLRIKAPNGTTFWDDTNDFSFSGVTGTLEKISNIPLYDGDTLIWGNTPDGPVSTPEPTATPEVTPTATPEPGLMCGDVNMDGFINIIDALMIAQWYVNILPPGEISLAAADVNGSGSVDIIDALMLAQYAVGLPVVLNCNF